MAERTAEDWGRIAVSLPGWRWMPGMNIPEHGRVIVSWYEDKEGDKWPDPDDPATAGCLLALLGDTVDLRIGSRRHVAPWVHECIVGDDQSHDGRIHTVRQPTIGKLCIAAAAALGRWPGGAE